MPRGPRLDAPGVLQHVMARAGDRQLLFRDDHDRDDFVRRVAALADAKSLTVYAWALLSNHFHLLVQTGSLPLARSMRSLLTGYAASGNRGRCNILHLLVSLHGLGIGDVAIFFIFYDIALARSSMARWCKSSSIRTSCS